MTRKLINLSSKIIDFIILVLLISMLAYGIYSIYSSYAIIDNAKLSDDIIHLKPVGDDFTDKLPVLREFDENIFSWLVLDGTKIDHPVVQGKDNIEYLKKDYKGNYSVSGAIFLDYRNNKDFSDSYSIIYGHHMEKSVMFGDLEKYREKDFFDTNKTGKIYLENKTLDLEIFACVVVSSKDQNIFSVDKNYTGSNARRIQYISQHALYYNGTDIDENSKIVAFSTCIGDTVTDRIVVFAKII